MKVNLVVCLFVIFNYHISHGYLWLDKNDDFFFDKEQIDNDQRRFVDFRLGVVDNFGSYLPDRYDMFRKQVYSNRLKTSHQKKKIHKKLEIILHENLTQKDSTKAYLQIELRQLKNLPNSTLTTEKISLSTEIYYQKGNLQFYL